ncbi:MAG: tetratricopeptide repeat protein [Rhodospirillales bacterium]|nr:tetratricopeptide repeat protein [Rhodospirillales bacterium]
MLLITLLMERKQYPEVIALSSGMIEKGSSDPRLLLYRAIALQATGDDSAARADLQAALRYTPPLTAADARFVRLMLADLAMKQGAFDDALTALDGIPEAEPSFDVAYRRSLALQGLGRQPEALAFNRSLPNLARTDDERLFAWKNLGESQKKAGDLPAALLSFSEAARYAPTDPYIARSIANIAEAQGDNTLAIDAGRRVIELEDNPADREWLANVLLAAGRRDEAISLFRQLREGAQTPVDQARFSITSRQHLHRTGALCGGGVGVRRSRPAGARRPAADPVPGQRAGEGRQQEEALAVLRAKRRSDPSPQIDFYLGMALAKSGDLSGAGNALRSALAGNLTTEQRWQASKQLGHTAYGLGDYGQAEAAFGQALAIRSTPELLRAQGETLQRLNRPEEAVVLFRRAAVADSSAPTLRALANAETAAGNDAAAIATLRRVLAGGGLSRGERGEVLETLGGLEARQGNSEAAIAAFQEALSLGRPEERIRRSIGFVYAGEGRWQDALPEFRRVTELSRTGANLLLVGRAARATGDDDEAISAFYGTLFRKERSRLPSWRRSTTASPPSMRPAAINIRR